MLVDLTIESRHEHTHPLRGIPYTMPDEGYDHSLVRRMAAGDEAAMHELYAAYGQRLYAYALRLTSDQAQAEDVVQDALVAAWKSTHRFRGEGRVIAWLLGIVHHLALKSLRHRSQPLTEEIEEMLEDGSPSPEEQIESAEQTARVRAGLRALSPEHRSILELIFYQGLSLEEAARVCRVPLVLFRTNCDFCQRNPASCKMTQIRSVLISANPSSSRRRAFCKVDKDQLFFPSFARSTWLAGSLCERPILSNQFCSSSVNKCSGSFFRRVFGFSLPFLSGLLFTHIGKFHAN
jgi:RNA polymerase sigma-70 factor (ECF subfamily)